MIKLTITQMQKRIVLIFTVLAALFCNVSYATPTTFKKGSIIIDMGAATPTAANSLKPYGLIYDLLKNYNTPVSCIVSQSKIKDGIDFTHNGKSYRGGPFIIPAGYRTTIVDQAIASWVSQGVLIDSLISDVALEVSYTMSSAPKWVMDATNGRIAVAYLTAAGIPASAYIFKGPSQLNSCDDIYVMPHADPTWNGHNNLYFWNKNNKGAIWAGCHAPSVLENLTRDTTINGVLTHIQMNFLTTTGLVNYANHTKTVKTPFEHLLPSSPMSQYIGISDAAQVNGSEQYFLTKLGGAWNPSVKIITTSPTQGDPATLSAGPAVVNVFGQAFNDPTRGYVAYQGAHSFTSSTSAPTAAQIAAQRMFFNFSFFAIKEKLQTALTATLSGIPNQMVSGTTYTGLTVTAGGSNAASSYKWTSNVPGTFSNATGAVTSFTPNVTATTNAVISCLITDACGRTTFDTKGGIIVLASGTTFTANSIAKTIDANCGSSSIIFNVFDSNVDANAGNRTLTAVSSFTNGTASFSSDGNITYKANANFNGTDNGTYTISNGINSATASIGIAVGSVALSPVANTDAATVLEDSVTVINVLSNDKNNPSASSGNKLYIRDIITKPSKGYVYINANGTVSYVTTKDLASGTTDQFTYLIANDLG